ncbi:hypothetical protein [Rubinisphaera italica]|uniref:DUF4365 domain-containing protein n=1 Tax=Rubinisphaera italica TaxID=2527969 RepID=A0A5C5XM85_9PLAN|nr:hypothetical protein [Rubinisphaera italica]TWT64004.1 hypothetical protein Pan54_47640 [Rubinisphaera italica]
MVDVAGSRLLGRAAEHVVVAEFQLRGYEVVVPDLDCGVDLYVRSAEMAGCGREMKPVQVKAGRGVGLKRVHGFRAQFRLPWKQLLGSEDGGLVYVLIGLCPEEVIEPRFGGGGWESIVISRSELLMLMELGLGTQGEDQLVVSLTFRRDRVTDHGIDLQWYRNWYERVF